MTDRQLQKLSRKELLEMLVRQGRELRMVQEKYEKAQQELDDRTIRLEEAGSIAEAALRLNGVFEAAQAACAQYTESVMEMRQRQDSFYIQREEESRLKAEQILAAAQAQSDALRRETEAYCAQIRKQAQEDAEKYWEAAYSKVCSASREQDKRKGR